MFAREGDEWRILRNTISQTFSTAKIRLVRIYFITPSERESARESKKILKRTREKDQRKMTRHFCFGTLSEPFEFYILPHFRLVIRDLSMGALSLGLAKFLKNLAKSTKLIDLICADFFLFFLNVANIRSSEVLVLTDDETNE